MVDYILKKFVLLIVISLFLSSYSVGAQEIVRIDMKKAVNIAIEKNMDINAAKYDVKIAKNNIKVADRLLNPDVEFFKNFGQAGRGNPDQVGVSTEFEILKRGARKNLAKSEYKVQSLSLKQQEFNTKMDVRQAYIALISAKSVLETYEQQLKLQEELLTLAKKRVKPCNSVQMDVIQAEIARNQLYTQVNSAKIEVRREVLDFNKSINSDSLGKIIYDSEDDLFSDNNSFADMLTIDPKHDLPKFDDIVDKIIENRFDIIIAKQQLESANKNLVVTIRKRIPDFEVGAGYSFQNLYQSEDEYFKHGAYVGAALVNIPVFYNYSPEIKNAKMQVEQAQLRYDSVKHKAYLDLLNAYEKFVTAKVNLNFYDDNMIKSSNSMINLAKKNYEDGKADLTSLIVMKQTYKSLMLGYTYALTDYYKAWIDLLREINRESLELSEEAL